MIATAVRLESVAVLICLAVSSWIIYKVLLRSASLDRHRSLRELFSNLLGHIVLGMTLFGAYEIGGLARAYLDWAGRISPYVGFLAVIWGCVVFIKIARIMAFEYLFLGSMRAGVPLLLVNLFTLVLSLFVGGWVLRSLFDVNLTSILATSAILSIVLGLALQDTLGNLFAGIALQFDKPFELGDWIEVRNGSEKIAGQVEEISWRATVLLSVTDELITIPNRNMAQWQISNFAAKHRPFVRSHLFRIPYSADIEKAKFTLVAAAESVPGILRHPSPVVIAVETNESWILLRATYSIVDYGLQYSIADRFLEKAVGLLNETGIELAPARLRVELESSAKA